MKKGVGLILTGGGGKGAYQVGVWKAIREYGIDKSITHVAGTSIGALNAVLFAQGDYELAERIWLNISPDQVLTINNKTLKHILEISAFPLSVEKKMWTFLTSFFDKGIFSREGLEKLISQNIDLSYISCSSLKVYVAAVQQNNLSIKYFNLNGATVKKIKKILLASSALPVIFNPENIDGIDYIDGGIIDNIPVQPLYDAGVRNFIVMHLAINNAIDYGKFKDANIIEIVPANDLGNLFTGTMNFNPECTKKRLQEGYEDTIKVLKPFYEMGIVQKKIGKILNDAEVLEACFREQRSTLKQKSCILKEFQRHDFAERLIKMRNERDKMKKKNIEL